MQKRVFVAAAAVVVAGIAQQAALKSSSSKPLPSLTYVARTGWALKSADSQESGFGGVNAFDGNPATFWHTQYSGGSPAHPHEIQIDLGASRLIAGFTYLPRQDGCGNGTIKQYEFHASADGANWGAAAAAGTFAYPASINFACGAGGQAPPERMVTFPSVSARFIRLRSLSDVNNSPYASAAELNIVDANNASTPAFQGQWSNVIATPVIPVGAAALPDGKVLLWSSWDALTYGAGPSQTATAVFDPATGASTQRLVSETNHDMFCPGVSLMADGRLMLTGGEPRARPRSTTPARPPGRRAPR